jgi:integrase
VSPRTVNKTVPSLLRRVMRRARKNWSVTILKEPDWKEHFVPERRRPVREITAEEDTALDEVESLEYAQLREFAEIMGLRRRELLLTWPQVDFKASTIAIIGKGSVPAILPLTRRAYEILWGLRGNDGIRHAVPIEPGLQPVSPENGNISNMCRRLSAISLPQRPTSEPGDR